MKGILLLYIFSFTSTLLFPQAVGYQGKKFIVQLGYAPANNLSAILLDYNLEDDHYTNNPAQPGQHDPLLFKHIPKIEIEYVVGRYSSVFMRYHPFQIISNAGYIDQGTGLTVDVAGVQSKGNMFSLGCRKYMTGNIAPLGSYWGLYGTLYPFKNSFVESKFSDHPLPESFSDYLIEPDNTFGLFAEYGVKNIFAGNFVIDIQIDAGYFFKNLDNYKSAGYGDAFSPFALASDKHAVYYTVRNTRAFFFLTPSVNIGFLVF